MMNPEASADPAAPGSGLLLPGPESMLRMNARMSLYWVSVVARSTARWPAPSARSSTRTVTTLGAACLTSAA
jgi:hypothetical protein